MKGCPVLCPCGSKTVWKRRLCRDCRAFNRQESVERDNEIRRARRLILDHPRCSFLRASLAQKLRRA